MSETMTSWQPIETAPRDGRRLLLWDPSRDMPIFGCWAVEWDGWKEWAFDWKLPQPTHWIPVPPAPKEGDDE